MKHRLISHPSFFSKEERLLNQLFELGLPCLHMRKPNSDTDSIEKVLRAVDAAYHPRIIIYKNDIALLEDFDLRGIHFKEMERTQLQKAALLDDFLVEYKNYELGTSIHSPKDLITLNEGFDYTFVSPVFDSISKQNYKATINWSFSSFVPPRVHPIALGGLDVHNIALAAQKGFSEVAFLGAVWGDFSQVITNYKKICRTINDLMPCP